MKLLPQLVRLKFSTIILVLCSLTLIFAYMSMDVSSLAATNDNRSNDRMALLAFKNEIIHHDPLGILNSWDNKNTSLHFCEWRGVACSHRHPSRVTSLDLNSQGLVGSISPYIGNLSFLKYLILHNNSLKGEIPQQIGRLFRLKHLTLRNNSLEGKIPHNISRCSNLVNLYIDRNNLVGSIPNELGYLPNLKIIAFGYNNLSGEIPTSLGNISSLVELGLGFNNFEGKIPSTLSQLKSLKLLILDLNRLSGVIPSSLYNISSLETFALLDNQLHGSIPFFTLPNLTYFSVGVNKFTGIIPSSFSNSSRLKMLDLGENSLVGSVPNNLGNLKSLEKLHLGGNKLGSGEANDLSFLNSLVNCTLLRYLIASGNNFGGVLPSSISNLTKNLDQLDFSINKIHGSIPPGIQNLVALTSLTLGSNQFTGSIPQGIGLLQNLGRLVLEGNKLFGSIPSSFGNLTQLIQLILYENNLTGLIPSSLGNCKFLQYLDLASNRLSGSIPKQVFQLPSLSIMLDLSFNSFTGTLPVEVDNLKNLFWLDVSENKLFSDIPSTIGKCLSLKILYLGSNFFQGSIPQSLTFLEGLDELNLSHNNLSGIVPKGFENLPLTVLDISYNNLEGLVPKDGVFKNKSAFSIDGNSKLCGGIPELKLPNCSVPINPSMKQKQVKSKPVKVIIISSVISALFLTLVVLSLCWKRKSKTQVPSTDLDVRIRFKGVSYNELLKATNGFNDSTNLLGVGSFGSVYKGILQQIDSKPIAVKVIHLQQRGATKSFIAECDALRKIKHRNLLKIITSCSSIDFQGNPFKALIFELMANGNLENWLHPTMSGTNNDDQLQVKNLNLKTRLGITVDVAYALKYLHYDCASPIIHCDLKPSNVLLDDDLTAHVGDFGLAKFLYNPSSNSRQLNENQVDASSIAIKGSIGYVSPEYGMGGKVSTQGDVYSYGILLLEMFPGKRPTDDIFKDGLSIHSYSKMNELPERVEEIIDSRLLLELREDDNDTEILRHDILRNERRDIWRETMRQILVSIIQIGVRCSSELPSDRTSMNEVLVQVQAAKNKFLGF